MPKHKTKWPEIVTHMPFGEYRGCPLNELDDAYFARVLQEDISETLRRSINRERGRRFMAAIPDIAWLREERR